MAQPQITRHSTNLGTIPNSADGTTVHLRPGETAFNLAPTGTKYWAGDGTLGNRLLLSTVDTDTPALTANYLKRSGGALTGAVTSNQTTFAGNDLVTKDFVEAAVAAGQRFEGTYDVPNNIPDLSNPANFPTTNGAYFMVSPGGTITAAIPGLTPPVAVSEGDQLVWDDTAQEFSIITAGGITLPQADARFLQLAGGTMSTGAVITMPTGYIPTGLQVATASYVDDLVDDYLPLAGGTLTGPGNLAVDGTLTLAADATANLEAVPLQQLNSAITTGLGTITQTSLGGPFLALTGGTLTGSLRIDNDLFDAIALVINNEGHNYGINIDNGTVPLTDDRASAIRIINTAGFDFYKGVFFERTNVQNGNIIGNIYWGESPNTITTSIAAIATENWSLTEHGTRIRFRTTRTGSNSLITSWLEDDGTFRPAQPMQVVNGGTSAGNATDARANLGITEANLGGPFLKLAGGTMEGNLVVPLANMQIQGGTSGYVLSTNGLGMLSWVAQGGSGGGIPEPTTAGNWLRSMNGSGSWVQGLALSGGTMTGELVVSLANLHIDGGLSGYVLATDGAGTLHWVSQSSGPGGGIPEPAGAGYYLRSGAGTWEYGLPRAGGTLTGPLTLSGNVPVGADLQAVPLQQLTAGLASITQSSLGGPFLPLTGGAVSNAITWTGAPSTGADLTNKDYVDQAIAQGMTATAWDVATNTPDITAITPTDGMTWRATEGGTVPAGLPGIGGSPINAGDTVIWNAATGSWYRIVAGGITQGDADARYLQLAGGTIAGNLNVNGNLTLTHDAATALEAVPLQQLTNTIAATPTVPTDGSQFQVLTKGAGTSFGWANIGDRPNSNFGIGLSALNDLDFLTSTGNVAIGNLAFGVLTTNSPNNLAIGFMAGALLAPIGGGNYLTQANQSTYIGSQSRASANNVQNEMAIGFSAVGHGNNTVTLGGFGANELWLGDRKIYPNGGAAATAMPIAFAWSGKPGAGAIINIPITVACTVAPYYAGSIAYAGTNPTGMGASFSIFRISAGGVVSSFGVLDFEPDGTWEFGGAAMAGGGTLAVGDVLQIVAPDPPDATFADVGVTIQTVRV